MVASKVKIDLGQLQDELEAAESNFSKAFKSMENARTAYVNAEDNAKIAREIVNTAKRRLADATRELTK